MLCILFDNFRHFSTSVFDESVTRISLKQIIDIVHIRKDKMPVVNGLVSRI